MIRGFSLSTYKLMFSNFLIKFHAFINTVLGCLLVAYFVYVANFAIV